MFGGAQKKNVDQAKSRGWRGIKRRKISGLCTNNLRENERALQEEVRGREKGSRGDVSNIQTLKETRTREPWGGGTNHETSPHKKTGNVAGRNR